MKKAIILWMGLLVLALPASAQQATPKALEVTAEIVAAEGQEREGAQAGAMLPGDVVQYTLLFTNVTDVDVSDVVFHDPIPQGMVIVPGSASADRDNVVVEYSIDGGQSWSAEPTVVVQRDGRSVRLPAPAERYTHVRWTIQGTVSPGAQVSALFRARVPASEAEVG